MWAKKKNDISPGGLSVFPVLVGKRVAELCIVLQGSCASIPPLKNSKIPGTNFLNPRTRGKIKTLDAAWWAAVFSKPEHQPLRGWRWEEKVLVQVLLSKTTRADADNAMATVRDWLEPPTKSVGRRQRGWGIGLVGNDSQIISIAMHQADLGIKLEQDVTFIFIKPLLTEDKAALCSLFKELFRRSFITLNNTETAWRTTALQ